MERNSLENTVEVVARNESEHKKYHHQNVLLLALSTFPGKKTMEENKFFCDWSKEPYTGIYQLDPIPRMLKDKLSEQGEYLDKIILLCTDKTVTKNESITITYSDDTTEVINQTAREYFTEHVKPYMNPEESNPFIDVLIDEKNLEKGISDTIRKLREIKKPRLYVDTHGGFREVSLVAEAIISLLKVDGIPVQGIYGVEFNNNMQNRIVDSSGGFHMFEFVSGMNEFINYGRADSLKSFMEKHSQGKAKDPRQDELLTYIKDIADGIQLCDIPKYEGGLDKLTRFYNSYGSDVEQTENTYLSIFMENIRNDYGKLLCADRDVIDEIDWCYKKGFYQQVLTLAESRVPRFLFEIGTLSCDDRLKKHIERKIEERKDRENKKKKEMKSKPLKSQCADDNKRYEIELYNTCFNDCMPRKYPRGGRINYLLGIRPSYSKTIQWKKKLHECIDRNEKNYGHVIVNFANEKIFDEYMRLHMSLKELRNHSNHASEDGNVTYPSMKQTQRGIKRYIELLQIIKDTMNFTGSCCAVVNRITKNGIVMLDIIDTKRFAKEQCILLLEESGITVDDLKGRDEFKVIYKGNKSSDALFVLAN